MSKIRSIQARAHAALIARNTRGVSMLEYVLIAAVVITLAGLFVPGLRGVFSSLIERVQTFIGSGGSTSS